MSDTTKKALIDAIENSKSIVADKSVWEENLISSVEPELSGDPSSQERFQAAENMEYIVEDQDVDDCPRMPIKINLQNGQTLTVFQDVTDFEIYDKDIGGRIYDEEVREKILEKNSDAIYAGDDLDTNPKGFAKFVCGDFVEDQNVVARSTLERENDDDDYIG